MNPKRFLPIFLLLLLLLPSCRIKNKVNFLSYQVYPFQAKGKLFYDGREYGVDLAVERAGDLTLTVLSPELLAGTVFERKAGAVTVRSGELCLPIEDGGYAAAEGILLAAEMFFLESNSFSGADVVTENGVCYSRAAYTAPSGVVTVYIQKGLSFPEKITATLNGHEFLFFFLDGMEIVNES